MRIYLDNCCYGRIYDNQSSEKIISETKSVRFIRKQIETGKIELATSYMLHYEIINDRMKLRKLKLKNFLKLTEKFISE